MTVRQISSRHSWKSLYADFVMAMRCQSHYIPLVIIFVATVGSAAGFLAPGKFCFNASNAGESQIVVTGWAPGSKPTFSTHLFHHGLLAPNFSDYTGLDLFCSKVFIFSNFFFLLHFGACGRLTWILDHHIIKQFIILLCRRRITLVFTFQIPWRILAGDDTVECKQANENESCTGKI